MLSSHNVKLSDTFLRDESGASDYAYLNTWRYAILVELAKHILRYAAPARYRLLDPGWWRLRLNANLRRVKRFLKQNYGTIAPSFAELLVDRARQVRSLNIRGFGVDSGLAQDPHTQLVQSINIVCRSLEDLVLNELPIQKPIYVMFDQLDRGWDATQEFGEELIGLILAARDLVRKATTLDRNLHIVIFLRSDIYAHLRFEDKNKLFPDVVNLKWDSDNLRSMLDRRTQVSAESRWEGIVTDERMRRRMEPFDYIVQRTMLRPRDLIQFCINAQKAALDERHSRIEKEDIYAAERPYSQYMKREFQDETRATYENMDRVFDVLRAIGTEKLNIDQFVDEYEKARDDQMLQEPMQAMQELIELSIVGIQHTGGKYGGSQIVYRYLSDPDARLEPQGTMTVHPSLKYALNLAEKRKSRTERHAS